MSDARSIGVACGKVILLGEHAVVYGVPALAVGIERGARAFATPRRDGASELLVRGWNIRVRDDETEKDLARAFRGVLAASRAGAFDVEVEADLPPGAGLGCSAAIGVAVARAIAPTATNAEIAACAMEWERVFHGNPSGVDAAVAQAGGCIFFKRDTDGAANVVENVAVRGGLALCIGHSGMVSSTKSMVETVARQRARRPDVVEKAFEGIRALVGNARLAIEAGDKFALGRLMDLNQMLLSGLFVSSEEIERMCDLARGAGALGAKLTGAGGGGCVVALVASASVGERVLDAWKRSGFDGFATSVAATREPRSALGEAAP
jgi:mevalonate kinase